MASVRSVARFILRNSVRASISAAGFLVLGLGLVMLVTPGPGLVVIVAGLAILATQYAWAERALDTARSRATAAREAALRRAPRRRQSPGAGAG
ncbi:MAG: PGPGW domain-containing protein [Actinomycetota bacterium]|nr:PGPGW domain-containing protein [Actinomycetota bacterium]